VTHTRPVGATRDPELRARVLAKSERLLTALDCHQVHATFEAFDSRFQLMDRSPNELLADLADCWQYLIERDPRVIEWISAF
jgi:hypothetical protein